MNARAIAKFVFGLGLIVFGLLVIDRRLLGWTLLGATLLLVMLWWGLR